MGCGWPERCKPRIAGPRCGDPSFGLCALSRPNPSDAWALRQDRPNSRAGGRPGDSRRPLSRSNPPAAVVSTMVRAPVCRCDQKTRGCNRFTASGRSFDEGRTRGFARAPRGASLRRPRSAGAAAGSPRHRGRGAARNRVEGLEPRSLCRCAARFPQPVGRGPRRHIPPSDPQARGFHASEGGLDKFPMS